MNTAIITVDGVQFLLYVKAERKHGNVSCFSVLAFEEIVKDSHGQKLLHEILDQASRKPQDDKVKV
jgi:hypothetical protein